MKFQDMSEKVKGRNDSIDPNYRPCTPTIVPDKFTHVQPSVLPILVICALLMIGGIELNPAPPQRSLIKLDQN